MHCYNVHETFTKIVKFMVPGSGVQAVGRGLYGHVVKMYLILENFHIHLRTTKCMVMASKLFNSWPLYRGSLSLVSWQLNRF